MVFWTKELFYVIVIALGSMNNGQTMAFYSPAGDLLIKEFNLTQSQGTLFNTIAPVFAVAGGPLVKLFVKSFGRRIPTFVYGLTNFVCWITIFFCPKGISLLLFIVRSIQGLCLGGTSSLLSMYIIEISPSELRGAYGSMHQLAVTIGAAFCYSLGLFSGWRHIPILLSISCLIHTVLIFFIPDSPVVETDSEGNKNESVFQNKFLKPVLHALAFVFFQQYSGINALSTNLNQIFSESKVSISPSLSSTIVGVSSVIATLLSTRLVEKLGRRPSWIISAFGQAFALFLAAANSIFTIHPIIPLIALFIDISCFGLGFGPIPWFIVPELFPDSVRSLIQSLATGINWLLGASTMFLWPVLKEKITIGWGFFSFGIVCVLAAFYGFFLMPETKGTKIGQATENV